MDWIKQRLDWERYPRPAVSNFADATLRERFLPKTWFDALTDDQIAAVASYIPQSRVTSSATSRRIKQLRFKFPTPH
jgi:cytochrome c553